MSNYGLDFVTSFLAVKPMGERGPEPTNLETLKACTENWAGFLKRLRDGEDGSIQEVVYKPWKEKRLGKETVRYREYRILRAKIVPVGEENWHNWPTTIKRPGENPLIFIRPIVSAPHLWNELKEDRSIVRLRQTTAKIRKWWKAQSNGLLAVPTPSKEDPLQLLSSKRILDAKKLWNYPNGNLRHSDDRRIEFMAKSLAGLMCGIAPATATKRLCRWHPSTIREQNPLWSQLSEK